MLRFKTQITAPYADKIHRPLHAEKSAQGSCLNAGGGHTQCNCLGVASCDCCFKCTFWQSKVVVWQITHQNSFVSWRRDPPCMSVWHEWETRHPQNTNRPDRRDDRWGSIAGSVADKASHIWRRMRQQTTAANHLGVSIFVFIGEPRYFRGISRTKRILRSFSSESSLQSISSKILLWKRNDSSVVLWT